MKIVIAGGTGFLGRPLAAALAADGHDVVILTRGDGPRRGQTRSRAVAWTPDGEHRPVGRGDRRRRRRRQPGRRVDRRRRWTAAQKQRILDSRVHATRSLVAAIQAAAAPPPVFVSGSAVGYYGPRGDEVVTEDTPAGTDFLATVCVQWEAEAMRAASDRTRVVVHPDRARAREGRRRAAADAAAVQVRRRRTGRIGPSVLAVDSSRRLDRARALGDPHTGGGRAAERDRAEPGDQRRVRAGARPRDAPPRVHAGARLRAAADAGRDGGCAAAVGPARRPRAGPRASGSCSATRASNRRWARSSGSRKEQMHTTGIRSSGVFSSKKSKLRVCRVFVVRRAVSTRRVCAARR